MDYDPARVIGLALPVRGRGRWLLCSKLLGSAFGNILGSCFDLLFLVSGTGRRAIGYDYSMYHNVMSLHVESRAVVD